MSSTRSRSPSPSLAGVMAAKGLSRYIASKRSVPAAVAARRQVKADEILRREATMKRNNKIIEEKRIRETQRQMSAVEQFLTKYPKIHALQWLPTEKDECMGWQVPEMDRPRLFCFPYAGGTASFYERFFDAVPGSVKIVPVELPGRVLRKYADRPATCEEMASAFVDACGGFLGDGVDFGLVGFGMGAYIALEVAKQAKELLNVTPLGFYVFNCRAPHVENRLQLLSDIDEDIHFVMLLERRTGCAKAMSNSFDIRDMMWKVARDDCKLWESYTHPEPEHPLLGCPTFCYGNNSDEYVTRDDLESWSKYTSGNFGLTWLDLPSPFFLDGLLPDEMAQDFGYLSYMSKHKKKLAEQEAAAIKALAERSNIIRTPKPKEVVARSRTQSTWGISSRTLEKLGGPLALSEANPKRSASRSRSIAGADTSPAPSQGRSSSAARAKRASVTFS